MHNSEWTEFGLVREKPLCIEVRLPLKVFQQVAALVSNEIQFSDRRFVKVLEKRYSSETAADRHPPARAFGFEGFSANRISSSDEVKRFYLPKTWNGFLSSGYAFMTSLMRSRQMLLFIRMLGKAFGFDYYTPIGIVSDAAEENGLLLTAEFARFVELNFRAMEQVLEAAT